MQASLKEYTEEKEYRMNYEVRSQALISCSCWCCSWMSVARA